MPKSKRHPARRPQQRTPKRPHPPRTSPTSAEAARSDRRRRFESASAPLLLALHRLPKLLVPVLLAVFLVVGLWLPWRVATVLVLLDALFLAWLLALSWPLLDTKGRLLRLATVAALVLAAVLRMAHVF